MIEIIASILFIILPPCQEEDSSWCSWDDGSGASFVSLWPQDPAPYVIHVD
jgi:hypothetical protein